jgi:hypothetical protein
MRDNMESRSAEELTTARRETAVRLRSAGLDIPEDTDPSMLADLLEAVEQFEAAVRMRGGDLMVDEPPEGQRVQPDDERFVLPQPRADESINQYRDRIVQAARAL